MKFKNTDDLLDKILNNELIVEMKLKKGNVVNAFGDKRLPVIFYSGKEKWVKCRFEDFASFSPIKNKYKIKVVPVDDNFKGRDYYFSDLLAMLNMEDDDRTKIRVFLNK